MADCASNHLSEGDASPNAERDARHHADIGTDDRLESDWRRDQPSDRRDCLLHALSVAARHRAREGLLRVEGDVVANRAHRRHLRRRRLYHADLLRPVFAADDRPVRGAVPDRRIRELHQLHDRAQSRRDGLHRRGGEIPHLFGLGARHRRRCQDRLRHRADVLAGQCLRARDRHGVRARSPRP